MISVALYKVIHLFAMALLFVAVGGVALHAANGGTREGSTTRRLVGTVHGIAIVLLLVSGFGMLARLGVAGGGMTSGWVWVKLLVLVALGAMLTLPYRRPAQARMFLLLIPVLGLLAAIMAIYKPF